MAALTWTLTNNDGFTGTWASGTGAKDSADAPTGTEGIDLSNVQAVALELLAGATNETLSGGGNLICYWKSPKGKWNRFKLWDIALATEGVSGVYANTFLGNSAGFGFPVIYRGGRVCWVPSAVTASGANVVLNIYGLVGGRIV